MFDEAKIEYKNLYSAWSKNNKYLQMKKTLIVLVSLVAVTAIFFISCGSSSTPELLLQHQSFFFNLRSFYRKR